MSRFRAGFFVVYRAHHERVHGELPAYARELESARLKVAALGLLNTLTELGEQIGTGLEQSLAGLGAAPVPCTVLGSNLNLEGNPWCDVCGLKLDQSLPIAELARLTVPIEVDLGTKNQRLSRLLVERILLGRKDERLEDFISIVQASDLSALSNTLDPELVAFIRTMLA